MKKKISVLIVALLFVTGCGSVVDPSEEKQSSISEISETVMQEIEYETKELEKSLQEYEKVEYKPLRDTTIDDVAVTDIFMTYFYPFIKDGILRTWYGAETYFNNNNIEIQMNGRGTSSCYMKYDSEDGDSIFFSFDKNDPGTNSKIEKIIYHREDLNADLCWFSEGNYYTFSIVGTGNRTKLNTFGEALAYIFDPIDTESEI